MIPAGRLRHLVTLSDGTVGAPATSYSPSAVWADIQPGPPSTFDDQRLTHQVTLRYHAQVCLDTKITHRNRALYVRGMQNIDDRNGLLVLVCEEVATPE